MKVYLVGEGPNELGGRAGHPSFQRHDDPGVLEALLRRVQAPGWEVGGATPWKGIRKFSAKASMSAETRNVLGAAQGARDHGCDVLVLVRDRDADDRRGDDVKDGLGKARHQYPDIHLVGGVAIERIEAWILALRGEHGSEGHKHPERRLVELGVAPKSTLDMVNAVTAADIDHLPNDAHSLRDWISQARNVLMQAT